MITICDDDLINEFKQDFALNHSIQHPLLSFIFSKIEYKFRRIMKPVS
jgi:hypothetical protein